MGYRLYIFDISENNDILFQQSFMLQVAYF